ncbi:MAG: hypothetical protein M1130_11680 [Actinobacteria bacterium]|nr:hypothetical protein [Actinomycetota bacterium]
MGLLYRGKEDVTDSIGLLISILVRYPEVATINYDPGQRVLKFTFITSRVLEPAERDAISGRLLESIEVFSMLEGKAIRLSAVDYQECESFTMVEIQRDVETLKQEEIALIVELFRQSLENSLITDEGHSLYEEDLVIQEEIIEHMLESVRDCAGDKKLFAFREEGRVLVFNK